ncbi:MAG: aminotransferase class I/II-fold pyridoxal phosphate-dependent enzyme [Thiohalomonadales bacterium]
MQKQMRESDHRAPREAVVLADRLKLIRPFYAMAMLDQAKRLEAQGKHIIHMEVGEPDFVTAAPIIAAATQALQEGRVHYTAATGLPALRESIASHYQHRYLKAVLPGQVMISTGASGALILALAAILNPGDEVLMADPGYPCNKNFVQLFAAKAVEIAVGEPQNFQLCIDSVQRHWTEKTKLVMLASPSNPTGTVISPQALNKIAAWVEAQGAWLVVDEIYHGLVYDTSLETAALTNAHTIVVNSFSKYYGMTGWRLGWLVAHENIIDKIDVLAQNMFLAPPTVAQYAALACFSEASQQILQQRCAIFQQRRDYLHAELQSLGFDMYASPAGAFYLYVGCEKFSKDSMAFCQALLQEAGVATTPGADFGDYQADRHLRFAYTTTMNELEQAVDRLQKYLA